MALPSVPILVPVDFGALLARSKNVKAAPVTILTTREAYKYKRDETIGTAPNRIKQNISKKNHGRDRDTNTEDDFVLPRLMGAAEAEQGRRASELAYHLSLRTPLAKMEKELKDREENQEETGSTNDNNITLFNLVETIDLEERKWLEKLRQKNEESLPRELHGVQLGDWESKINWEGVTDDKVTSSDSISPKSTATLAKNPRSTPELTRSLPDPMAILSETFNPAIEALDLDNLISWEGANAPPGFNDMLAQKMGKLILQDGVAGLSVAAKSGALATINPTPFNQSDVFLRRMEDTQNSSGISATVGSLQKDHVALEKEIKLRQQKRAQMAIDKTNRITGALGKLDFGGGTGRRVTSSLMGPGGTERSGRPNKQNVVSHDATYVEQLDMIMSHHLVHADLSYGELRHYHRPLLPRMIFKPETIMPWQFQVQIFPNTNPLSKRKGGGGADGSLISSYQNSMINNMPGTLSQTKIRNGADLSPTEGELIILEYSEEKPPIQLTKGMASKIVNYYRGDRSKCPVSAGGGDRPLRKKKHGNQSEDTNVPSAGSSRKIERPPRLVRNISDNVTDLIGKIPNMKKSDDHLGHGKEPMVTVLPEGATEMLHAKDHGPFIGQIKDGDTQSGLISNLFAAPIFRHEPRSTDFLLTLGKIPNKQEGGGSLKLPVVIRPMPDSMFAVGQTEPKTKVHPPDSSGERSFFQSFSVFQIAKGLQRKQNGLRFEDIKDGLFPYAGVIPNQLRLRIKKVAIYDKNTQIWTLKDLDFEDFPGVEVLGREFSPEGVAANWTARAATLRLQDLGINHIYRTANGTANVAAAMTYLNGQIRAARQRWRMYGKVKNHSKYKNNEVFAQAEGKLEAAWKALKRKGELANFIHEELQLAPWQATSDFIEVHKEGKGSGMMKLTGLGDPSGTGSGFNFIREVEKANKSSPNGDGALNARVKKITGTDKDLRKLNMGQMASILREYGMVQKDIDKLKRWDRVHCIRDLSTKAASDNMGDGLERFARGEKMKLSDQKKIYTERIQEIWNRQKIALSEDSTDVEGGRTGGFERPGEETLDDENMKKSDLATDVNDDDSGDDENDDFFNDMEDEFNDTEAANELVSNQLKAGGGKAFLSKGGNADDARDAIELAALKRQREEERAFQMDIDTGESKREHKFNYAANKDRKVIRRKITKTNPDGTQTVLFRFIVLPKDVQRALTEKTAGADSKTKPKRRKKQKSQVLPRDGSKAPVGHAMFAEEHEDGRHHVQGKRRGRGGRGRKADDDDYSPSRKPAGRSRSRTGESKPKRKRSEEDDYEEQYFASVKRKGTTNRKERGAARERIPHVMFADRLEQIRLLCEKRPHSEPFHRPVNKSFNVYHEKIKRPIDLQTIRDKIQKYDYRTVFDFVKDFDLMQKNAVTFNGLGSVLGNEATAIYDFVVTTVDENRQDLDALEVAVYEQMTSGKKGPRSTTPKLPSKIQAGKTANVTINGITSEVPLGNIQGPNFGDYSDSD